MSKMEENSDFKLSIETILKGMKGIAKAKLRIDEATEQKFNNRKEICLGCDKLVKKKDGDFSTYQCGKCGCWLKYKLLINSEGCPLKKW